MTTGEKAGTIITIGIAMTIAGLITKANCTTSSVQEQGVSMEATWTEEQATDSAFTFEDLLDAIEWVESKGDAGAIGDNGEAVGAFQISKIYVDDVNRIGKLKNKDKYLSSTKWEYYHRRSRTCSRHMANTYLLHYGGTFEEMARKHNGGPRGHLKGSTKPYWLKVKSRMESVK